MISNGIIHLTLYIVKGMGVTTQESVLGSRRLNCIVSIELQWYNTSIIMKRDIDSNESI